MAKRSANKIIESIAHVTGHADRELLEASLASTLYELLDVDRVVLYKVFYEHKQPQCYLALEVFDNKVHVHRSGHMLSQSELDEIGGLEECIRTQQTVQVQIDPVTSLYLNPINNHLGTVSGVFCLTGNKKHYQDNKKFIEGYFQIYRNYLHLLDKSEHDALTGLLNRRTFDQNLEKVLAEWHKENDSRESADANLPLRRHEKVKKGNWLAVIDIDHFKQVNDRFGHLYGDEVLLLLSNIMRESFRGYDKLFRFGGEEFVVILRATDLAGAAKALERFRVAVETYYFPQIGNITVCIGFTQITNQAIPAEVLGHADDALYYAKNHGRNRVCQFEQLVATGEIKVSPDIINQEIELF